MPSHAEGVGQQRSASLAILRSFDSRQPMDATGAVRKAHFGTQRSTNAVPKAILPSSTKDDLYMREEAGSLGRMGRSHDFCETCHGASLCQRCLGIDAVLAKQMRQALHHPSPQQTQVERKCLADCQGPAKSKPALSWLPNCDHCKVILPYASEYVVSSYFAVINALPN